MKVKILTGHSKKEQERRGLLEPSTRRHPGAMGAYWADTFFFPRPSSTLHQPAPQLGIRYTNFDCLISSRGHRGGAFDAGVWSPAAAKHLMFVEPVAASLNSGARACGRLAQQPDRQLSSFPAQDQDDQGIQRAPAIRGCRCTHVRRVYVEQKLVVKDSTRGCARVLSAGPTSGVQWGLPCQVAKCRRTRVVGLWMWKPRTQDSSLP